MQNRNYNSTSPDYFHTNLTNHNEYLINALIYYIYCKLYNIVCQSVYLLAGEFIVISISQNLHQVKLYVHYQAG